MFKWLLYYISSTCTECFSVKHVSVWNRTTANLSSIQDNLTKTKMKLVTAVITAHITAIQTRLTRTKMEKAMLVQLISMVMVRVKLNKLNKCITGNSPKIPLLMKRFIAQVFWMKTTTAHMCTMLTRETLTKMELETTVTTVLWSTTLIR